MGHYHFQVFDNGLRELLEPQGDRIPVVFAGDKGIFPIYRETNHYKELLDDFVEGNPDDIAPEALHERAWEVVEPHFRRALGADQDALMQAVGTARPARRSRRCCWRRSTPASTPSLSRWANASGASSTPTPARVVRGDEGPETYDLYDAAAYTLQYGGTVFAVAPDEIPGDGPLAARYRF